MKKKTSHRKKKSSTMQLSLNKTALIAAALNLILVGLGYAFLKNYKKAAIAFVGYLVAYFIIFYIATFLPLLIWLGLPVTLFFIYDAYRDGEKAGC